LEDKNCKNKRVHVVLFDFGGVLSEEGWKKGLRIIAKANGFTPTVSFKQPPIRFMKPVIFWEKARKAISGNLSKRKPASGGMSLRYRVN
jgi:hypothetical protein